MKTRKAAAKRFKMTKSGKLMRRQANRRHLLECKSTKQRGRLKKAALVSPADRDRVLRMLAGGSRG